MVVGKRGSDVALQILKLSNFINVTEVFLFCRSRAMCGQHIMVIGRNKLPVERSAALSRCTLLQKHRFFDQKFNLPMGVFSLKFLNCVIRHN